jgi:hypothetical protein
VAEPVRARRLTDAEGQRLQQTDPASDEGEAELAAVLNNLLPDSRPKMPTVDAYDELLPSRRPAAVNDE